MADDVRQPQGRISVEDRLKAWSFESPSTTPSPQTPSLEELQPEPEPPMTPEQEAAAAATIRGEAMGAPAAHKQQVMAAPGEHFPEATEAFTADVIGGTMDSEAMATVGPVVEAAITTPRAVVESGFAVGKDIAGIAKSLVAGEPWNVDDSEFGRYLRGETEEWTVMDTTGTLNATLAGQQENLNNFFSFMEEGAVGAKGFNWLLRKGTGIGAGKKGLQASPVFKGLEGVTFRNPQALTRAIHSMNPARMRNVGVFSRAGGAINRSAIDMVQNPRKWWTEEMISTGGAAAGNVYASNMGFEEGGTFITELGGAFAAPLAIHSMTQMAPNTFWKVIRELSTDPDTFESITKSKGLFPSDMSGDDIEGWKRIFSAFRGMPNTTKEKLRERIVVSTANITQLVKAGTITSEQEELALQAVANGMGLDIMTHLRSMGSGPKGRVFSGLTGNLNKKVIDKMTGSMELSIASELSVVLDKIGDLKLGSDNPLSELIVKTRKATEQVKQHALASGRTKEDLSLAYKRAKKAIESGDTVEGTMLSKLDKDPEFAQTYRGMQQAAGEAQDTVNRIRTRVSEVSGEERHAAAKAVTDTHLTARQTVGSEAFDNIPGYNSGEAKIDIPADWVEEVEVIEQVGGKQVKTMVPTLTDQAENTLRLAGGKFNRDAIIESGAIPLNMAHRMRKKARSLYRKKAESRESFDRVTGHEFREGVITTVEGMVDGASEVEPWGQSWNEANSFYRKNMGPWIDKFGFTFRDTDPQRQFDLFLDPKTSTTMKDNFTKMFGEDVNAAESLNDAWESKVSTFMGEGKKKTSANLKEFVHQNKDTLEAFGDKLTYNKESLLSIADGLDANEKLVKTSTNQLTTLLEDRAKTEGRSIDDINIDFGKVTDAFKTASRGKPIDFDNAAGVRETFLANPQVVTDAVDLLRKQGDTRSVDLLQQVILDSMTNVITKPNTKTKMVGKGTASFGRVVDVPALQSMLEDTNSRAALDILFQNNPAVLKNLDAFKSVAVMAQATTDELTGGVIQAFTLDAVLSRTYNVMKGVVSPRYVISEGILRLMRKHNSTLIADAFNSPHTMDMLTEFFVEGKHNISPMASETKFVGWLTASIADKYGYDSAELKEARDTVARDRKEQGFLIGEPNPDDKKSVDTMNARLTEGYYHYKNQAEGGSRADKRKFHNYIGVMQDFNEKVTGSRAKKKEQKYQEFLGRPQAAP